MRTKKFFILNVVIYVTKVSNVSVTDAFAEGSTTTSSLNTNNSPRVDISNDKHDCRVFECAI